MKNVRKEKRAYVKPQTCILLLPCGEALLANSPAVQVGNSGITVDPLKDDNDDSELVGAKHFKLWEEEDGL